MRRVQFSIRVLLALVTVLAILFSIVGQRVLSAHKQRQLVNLIQSYGGENHHNLNFKSDAERAIRFSNLDFSPILPGPAWLRLRIGDEFFVRAEEAFFDKGSHRVLDDVMFREFAETIRSDNLPRPRGLAFDGVPITDIAIKDLLLTFPDLTSLHITNCPGVTDAGLVYIKSLPKLRRLDLRGCSITDRGLFHLSNLIELRELSLKNTGVTNDGLAHLQSLANLEWLAIDNTSVTIMEIKVLRQSLPKCEMSW